MRATLLLTVFGVSGFLACGSSKVTPSDGGATKAQPADAPENSVKPEADSGVQAEAKPAPTVEKYRSGPTHLQDITIEIPKNWNRQAPTSSMRVAQFEIPGEAGSGSMAVFRFPGGGGSATANLTRWKGQLQPHADSRPPKQQVQSFGPFTVTSLDAVGKLAQGPMPGAPALAPIERARMLAAVVEGVGDAYFFKCTGPEETLSQHESAWAAMLASIQVAAKADSPSSPATP